MLSLHPNILEKNGIKEFAVLPFDEYLVLKEELQNYEDLKDLKEAKFLEENESGMSLSDAKKEWDLWTMVFTFLLSKQY